MRRDVMRVLARTGAFLILTVLPACATDGPLATGARPTAAPRPPAELSVRVRSASGEEGRQLAIRVLREDLPGLERRLAAGRGDPDAVREKIARRRDLLERLLEETSEEGSSASRQDGISADGEELRITEAVTEVTITDTGPSSSGRILVRTQTDAYAKIAHTIRYMVTTGGRTIPARTLVDETALVHKSHTTTIALNGLSCDTSASASADSYHEARLIFVDARATSYDNDDCAAPPKTACGDEPVDQEAVSSGDAAAAGADCVGGAAGGGEDSCRLFLITVHVSYDNGSTWFLQSQEVVEICDF